MRKTLTTLSLAALGVLAIAGPAWVGLFEKTYDVKAGSNLKKAKCAVCHTKGKELNAYGEDLKKALGGAKKLTPEILAKVEALDSDKDGVKDIDEIKKGSLPGDAKIK
jgi:mono/diheme cytochrome c family protein